VLLFKLPKSAAPSLNSSKLPFAARANLTIFLPRVLLLESKPNAAATLDEVTASRPSSF
jgi:hypothetical protein